MRRWLWIFDIGLHADTLGRAAGWHPLACTLSAMSVLGMAGIASDISLGWLLGIIGGIDLIAARYLLAHHVVRIKRLGLRGPTRALWWIECAAVSVTLWGNFLVFWLVQALSDQAGWPQPVIRLAFELITPLGACFLILATTGFALGLLQGRRVSGRALELVCFSYWFVILCNLSYMIPWSDAATAWTLAILGTTAVIAILVAAALKLRERRVQSPLNPRFP